MQTTSYLVWVDAPVSHEPVCQVLVNFATDLNWNLTCYGEYHFSNLAAKYVVVDNTGNQATLQVTIGPQTFTIDQYSRKQLAIGANTNFVGVVGVSGTVSFTFLIINRNPNLDGPNDFAIQAAVSQATANLVGQTVGPIINPAFDIWPQGAGPFASNAMQYGPEGWMTTRLAVGGNVQLSRVAGSVGGIYATKVQRIAADAGVQPIYFGSQMLSFDSKQFAGKTITIAISIKAGANFSGLAGVASFAIVNGIGNDENMFSPGFTGPNVVATQNVTLTGGTQRFQVSGAVPSNATQIGFQVFYTPTGVAGADDSFTVELCQLDTGQSAQAFRPVPYPLELERCRQFLKRIFNYTANNPCWTASVDTGASGYGVIEFDPMRVAPSIVISAAGDFSAFAYGFGALAVCLTLVTFNITPTTARMFFTVAPATYAFVGGSTMVFMTNPPNGYIELNARM